MANPIDREPLVWAPLLVLVVATRSGSRSMLLAALRTVTAAAQFPDEVDT